jgi:tetratricopeptide (TPR) repeat protein
VGEAQAGPAIVGPRPAALEKGVVFQTYGENMLANEAVADNNKSRPAGLLRPIYRMAVVGLLLLIAGEIFLSTRQESQVFDESAHLYAGYEYWKHGDFGHNPEHPPLAKLIAAAALMRLPLKEPPSIPGRTFKADDFLNATKFLYGADADQLLARGRSMLLIFTLGLALAVFAAGREMFAPEAGLLAMVLFALEPMLLANGGLITTDMALSCMLFSSVYAFYRYVKRPGWGWLAVCAIAVGLTLVAKQSGVFVFLILGALAVAELLLRRMHAIGEGAGMTSTRSAARSLALAVPVIALVSYAMLWAFYGFRYAARPGGMMMVPTLAVYYAAIPNGAEAAVIGFCARHHLLPEAYLFGWTDILQIPGARVTYLLGKLYIGSRWFLFPAMILLKSTLALLVLMVTVPMVGLWRRSREFLFLAIPPAIYLILAMGSGMNAEARYILPIYPFAIVLAGAAGWKLVQRSRGWTIAVAALGVFAAASSLHAFPDYLAYANEAFGGPANSYRLLSDSNGDWAQGLKWTKSYLDANHVSDCWFDYSDPIIDPAYYGIPCKPLVTGWVHRGIPASGPIPRTISGTILLSATELDGHLWGPDVLNPYAQFTRLRPDAKPGNIVLVYHGTFDVPLASAYAHSAVAGRLAARGRIPEALVEAQEAAALAPDSADIQAGLGRALMAAGKSDEARPANATALRLAQTVHPEFQAPLIRHLEQAAVKASQ